MMQDISLNFGVSGEERKRLVKAVSAYKQIPSEYLGVPSFAFRVDEMIIDRDGVLVIEGGMRKEELRGFLEYLKGKGFQADHAIPHQGDVEEAVAEAVTEDETVAEGDVITEAAVPEDPIDETVVAGAADAPEDDETVVAAAADALEDDEAVANLEDAGTEIATEEAVDEHTVDEIVAYDPEKETAFENDDKIVIETVAEKPMIMADVPVTEDTDKTVAEDMTEVAVVEHTVEEVTVDDPEETGIDDDEPMLTIQIPREGFTDQNLDTLQMIIKSKEHLLKKALDTDDLSILITDDRISFPWFQKNDPVSTSVYMHLVSAICDMAKRAKRVTVTNQDIESEKYAFRTWLIRLGFGGPEFKTQRAVLLQNLSGTSAFKNREAAEAFNERMKAKRVAARLTDN